MLQGQLCGLCGNYNQEIDDELTLPSKRIVNSFREYLVSSVVSSGTCRVQVINSVNPQYNVVGGQYVRSATEMIIVIIVLVIRPQGPLKQSEQRTQKG